MTSSASGRAFAFLAGALVAARMLDVDIDPAEALAEGPAELVALAEETEDVAAAGELRALARSIEKEAARPQAESAQLARTL